MASTRKAAVSHVRKLAIKSERNALTIVICLYNSNKLNLSVVNLTFKTTEFIIIYGST